MQFWKAHYRDAFHDTAIKIINTEEDYITEPLSFTLDNITFCGSSPGDFHLKDNTQYGEAIKKFSLLKWGGHYHELNITSPYIYDLQEYELEIEIPLNVFRKQGECLSTGVLFLSFKYIEPDMSKPHCIQWCDDIRVYRGDVIVQEFSLSVSSLGNSLKMQQKNRPYKRIQQVGEKNVHFKIVQGNFPEKGHKVVSLLEMRFLTG